MPVGAPGRRALKAALITTLVLAVTGGVAGAVVVYGGLYNVAATSQHTQVVYAVLEKTMHQSVRLRAQSIEAPALESRALRARGAACFTAKCEQCHGGPGVAPAEIGRSMQPLPGPLVDASHRWRPRELYWITRHGLKMTGMPAWEYRLADEDLWAVVAFMQELPGLTPRDYAALAQASAHARCDSAPD